MLHRLYIECFSHNALKKFDISFDKELVCKLANCVQRVQKCWDHIYILFLIVDTVFH